MRPRALFGATMCAFLLACVASVRLPPPASVSVAADAAAPLVEAASTSAPPQPLPYAEAIRRFPEMAAFPRPLELSEVEWLKGVETVRLWVDRSELWPGAPRGCSVYVFHRDHTPEGRDGRDWIAPRPRAGAPDALLRLRSYARLEAGDDAEVLGATLIVYPDRLAYTGLNAHLAARCEWDQVERRPGCVPMDCMACTRIRFYDVSDEEHYRWGSPPQGYRVLTAPDPSCAPCDPGPRAADLPLAQVTAAATRVLRPQAGPVFFRSPAGCAAHLRDPLPEDP
jgi:hypothetical protein